MKAKDLIKILEEDLDREVTISTNDNPLIAHQVCEVVKSAIYGSPSNPDGFTPIFNITIKSSDT